MMFTTLRFKKEIRFFENRGFPPKKTIKPRKKKLIKFDILKARKSVLEHVTFVKTT